jgi:hypothetical protein
VEEVSEVSDPYAGGLLEEPVGEGWEQCDECHDTHYVKDYEMFDGLLDNDDADGDEIMPPVEGEPPWMETVRECLNEPVGKGLDGVDQEFKDFMVEHYDMLTPEFQNLVRESGLAPDQGAAGDTQHAMLKDHTTLDESPDAHVRRREKTDLKQPASSVQVNGAQRGADKARGTKAPYGQLYGAGRHESRSMNLAEGHTDASHPQVCACMSHDTHMTIIPVFFS